MRLAAGALTHVSCAQHTSSGARGRRRRPLQVIAALCSGARRDTTATDGAAAGALGRQEVAPSAPIS